MTARIRTVNLFDFAQCAVLNDCRSSCRHREKRLAPPKKPAKNKSEDDFVGTEI